MGGLRRSGASPPSQHPRRQQVRFTNVSERLISEDQPLNHLLFLSGVNGGSASFSKPPADSSTNQANGSAPSSAPAALSCSRSREYSRQLAALNRSVRDWISKHVDDNPLCDLNPIFRDYERHLASIERKFGGGRDNPEEKAAPAEPAPPPSSGSAAAPPSGALFSFSRNSSESSSDPAPAAVTFNFGQKVDSSVLNPLGSKPLGTTFSFTPSPSQTPLFGAASSLAPLPLGGTKTEEAPPTGEQRPRPPPHRPMRFASVPMPSWFLSADENGDAESEEPPKPEVKEVKEDDAFYSKKYGTEARFCRSAPRPGGADPQQSFILKCNRKCVWSAGVNSSTRKTPSSRRKAWGRCT